jgi:hypothetical protein
MIDGTVTRIDMRSGRAADTIQVGGFPREIAFGAGAVWVTAYAR